MFGSALFSLRRCSRWGKFLIGLYIGKQGLESTYGAAASIIVVLIWVYYSAQLVLMGDTTNGYARRYGSLKHAASADRQASQPKPAVAELRARHDDGPGGNQSPVNTPMADRESLLLAKVGFEIARIGT